MSVLVRRVPAADEAYLRVRAEITAGRLMPGERLVEADLAESLGVSRAVVRAVLTRLGHDGLVEKEHNRGARVRTVSEAEAVEITQARSALEAFAAGRAAVVATPADIEEIAAILAGMGALLEQEDLIGYSEGNSRLHARILEASRHATVQRLVASLRAQMVRYQYRTILVPGRSRHSFSEHSRIVEAITRHDAAAAEAAMRAHLTNVTGTLVRTAGAARANQPAELELHGVVRV